MFPRFLTRWACFALIALVALNGCAKRKTLTETGRREQILYLGNGADPRDLDPQIDVAYNDYNVLIALFEGLTVIDEATSQPIPGIAEKWDISPDGLTYTFHLRDAQWSNGDPVTAGDFVFTAHRLLEPKLASENSYLAYPIAGAKEYNEKKLTDFNQVGVHALDPKTLRITLAQPTPYFLAMLTHQAWFPVEEKTVTRFGDPFSRNTGWTKIGNFVGNGAYTIESWAPDQRLVVKKNPRYWDAANTKLEKVVFYPIADETTEEANFRAGQMHITYDVLPNRIDHYRHEHPDQIRIDPFLETFFLRFNVTQKPFDDKRVRQALARAIDREAIANSVMRGSRLPAYSFTPPNTAGYNCSAKTPTDYDAARKLLAEAGFPQGRGFPHVDVEMNSDPINTVVLEAIQQTWRKELGIEVGLTQTEFRVYADDMHRLAFKILRSRWVADYNDPSNFIEMFVTNSPNNNSGWSNAEYDRLVDQANHELDQTKRFQTLDRAETLLLDEAPIAPVFFGTRTFLIDPHVKGWVPSLLGIHRYQKVWLE